MSPDSPDTARLPARVSWAFFTLCLCTYMLTASRWNFGYEGSNLQQARAIVTGTARHDAAGMLLPYTQGGMLEVMAYMPGAALESLPIPGGLRYALHVPVVPIIGAFTAWLGLLLAWELALSIGPALLAATALAFATMLFPYAKWGMEPFQTAFTIGAAAALLRHSRTATWHSAAAAGVCLGALTLTKVTGYVHAAALGAAALAMAAQGAWHRRPQFARHCAAVLAPAALLAALSLVSNYWRYHGWLVGGRYSGQHAGSLWHVPSNLISLLASPNKNLIEFNPPVLAGVLCLGAAWRSVPRFRPILLAIAVATVLHLSLDPWTDETWGPRRFHYLVPFLVVPLALSQAAGLRRWIAPATLVAGLAIQLLAVSFNFTSLPIVVGKSPAYSVEAMTWDPSFHAIKFHTHLLRSFAARNIGGAQSALPFERRATYFPWLPNGGARRTPDGNAADHIESFDIGRQDVLDLWLLQSQAGVPGTSAGRIAMGLALLLAAALCSAYLWSAATRRRFG